MASQQQSQVLSHSKARRAANNNYLKLSKTLNEKLAKLCHEYNTNIYFLAYRDGRFNGFVSLDETGQPWTPPSQEAKQYYPPPVMKSTAHFRQARRGRAKVAFRKAISEERSTECSTTPAQAKLSTWAEDSATARIDDKGSMGAK